MKKVHVAGNAFEETFKKQDSVFTEVVLDHQLKGKKITAYFHEGNIEKAIIAHNAINKYYDYDDLGKLKGINEVSGNKITVIWDKGKLERALITGASEGGYYPTDNSN